MLNDSRPIQLQLNINDDADQAFYDGLPYYPYCSDDVKTTGLKVLPRKYAARKRQIQYNPSSFCRFLAFDIDRELIDGYSIVSPLHWWRDCGLPPPNYILINPVTGNFHYLYALAAGVPLTDAAKLHPMRYLAAIEDGLRERLQADPAFAGLICKNPLNDHWEVFKPRLESYSLGELADYVPDIEKKKVRRKRDLTGLGRRMRIFDDLRYWAYSHVLAAKETMTFDQWFGVVLKRAEQLNTFNVPLNYPHVKSTAKSVAKWTWNHYTGSGSTKRRGRDMASNHLLSGTDKQSFAAHRTNKQRKTGTERRIQVAVKTLQLRGRKVTQKAVAEASGLNKNTVLKYKHLITSLK